MRDDENRVAPADAAKGDDARRVTRPVRSHPLAVPPDPAVPVAPAAAAAGPGAEGAWVDDVALADDGQTGGAEAVAAHVSLTAPAPMSPPLPVRDAGPAPEGSSDVPTPAAGAPTLGDLLAARPPAPPAPAQVGWRALLHRASGGVLNPAPGARERAHEAVLAAVRRQLAGPRTVVVVNPKGGAHKTTSALLLAATLGEVRGGSVLAWDNNETRGTLGWRAQPATHARTAVDLLRALPGLTGGRALQVGDLDEYVRAQPWGHFDVLASDEDAASAALVDAAAFERLHAALTALYRVVVVDTGNNMRASNWQAAVAAADQLVVVSTIREDTAQSAAWLADALRAGGHEQLVSNAVTVLTAPDRASDAALAGRVREHFARLTRQVVRVPHDASLIAGGPVDPHALSPATRRAWQEVAAAVVAGL